MRGEAERGSPEAPGLHGVREMEMGGQRFQRGKAQRGWGEDRYWSPAGHGGLAIPLGNHRNPAPTVLAGL